MDPHSNGEKQKLKTYGGYKSVWGARQTDTFELYEAERKGNSPLLPELHRVAPGGSKRGRDANLCFSRRSVVSCRIVLCCAVCELSV